MALLNSKNSPRPLSPHLQIYRPQITSVLSILHRCTGIILGAGSLPLVLWLGALAHGSQSYRSVMDWYTCIPGKVMMMGWAFCYYYHLANGVRHLIWDTGVGYELKTVYISGWIVIGFACLLTALTVWWIV